MGDPNKQQGERGNNGGVYAILDGGKYRDQNSSPPDNEFKRGYTPEGVNLTEVLVFVTNFTSPAFGSPVQGMQQGLQRHE